MTTTTPEAPSRSAAKAAPAPAVKPVRARRKPARFAFAMALILLGVLATVWYVGTVTQTTQVVAVATPIERGQIIHEADLAIVDLPAGPTALSTVPASQLDAVIGQYANADLSAGSTLTPESTVDALTPHAGTSIVGIALSPSQMPSEPLRAGDVVRIVETPINQGDPPAEDPNTISAVVINATNAGGEDTGFAHDQRIIDVEVDTSQAAALAARAATGRVALVLDSMEN